MEYTNTLELDQGKENDMKYNINSEKKKKNIYVMYVRQQNGKKRKRK